MRLLHLSSILLPALAGAQSGEADNNTTIPGGPTVVVPNLGTVVGVDRGVHCGPRSEDPDKCDLKFPSVVEFRGIPYAEPPVGELRWRPPKTDDPIAMGWPSDESEIFDGTRTVDKCLQDIGQGPVGSEDCLYMSVYAPKAALEEGADDENLPVYVFFPGGGFLVGGPQEFDFASFVEDAGDNGIVLVSLSYRLGALGFMGSEDMSDRTEGSGSGNFGIQDQRAALEWIRDNIAAFGGDASKVTIGGQSAGAISVINHLAAPDSFGLYDKAIAQSGTMDLGARRMDQSEEIYQQVLEAAGCDDLSCLVETDALLLLNASNPVYINYTVMPVVDGVSLTDLPAALISKGEYNNEVPVLIGSNRDEETGLSWFANPNITEAEFDAHPYFAGMDASTLAEVKRVYSPENYAYPEDLGEDKGYTIWYWMGMRFISDTIPGASRCGVRWVSQMLDAGGSPAVYNYFFGLSPNLFPAGDGIMAVHTSELLSVLHWMPNATVDQGLVADAMQSYWISFITSEDGDPNNNPQNNNSTNDIIDDLEFWPLYTTEGDEVLVIEGEEQGGIRSEQYIRKDACDWQVEQALKGDVFPGWIVTHNAQVAGGVPGLSSNESSSSSEASDATTDPSKELDATMAPVVTDDDVGSGAASLTALAGSGLALMMLLSVVASV